MSRGDEKTEHIRRQKTDETKNHKKHLWNGTQHVPLSQTSNYGLAVSWESIGVQVDLDLQAVIVNQYGFIIDVVYYNNQMAVDGAVALAGDSTDGTMCETIWVNLKKLPKEVKLVIFVLAAYNNTQLKDAFNAKLNIFENDLITKVATFDVEQSWADCDIVAKLRVNESGEFEMLEVDELAETGSHFLDVLEPTLGDVIRKEIPDAPFQRVSFDMRKGSAAHIDTKSMKRLSIGLGGEVADITETDLELDISVVFFSDDGRLLGGVDHETDTLYGVMHAGDNTYEHHTHIDEALSVDFSQIPDQVKSIFLVLAIGSEKGNFKMVQNLYIRVFDQSAHTLLRYELEPGHEESGLVVARFFRMPSRLVPRWSFEAIGKFFSKHEGVTWKKPLAQYEMLRILHQAQPSKVKAPKHPKGAESETHHHHHHHHGEKKTGGVPPAISEQESDGKKLEPSEIQKEVEIPKSEDVARPQTENDAKESENGVQRPQMQKPMQGSRCFTIDLGNQPPSTNNVSNDPTPKPATTRALPSPAAAELPTELPLSLRESNSNDKVSLRKKGKLQLSRVQSSTSNAHPGRLSDSVPVVMDRQEAEDADAGPLRCNVSWFSFLGPCRGN